MQNLPNDLEALKRLFAVSHNRWKSVVEALGHEAIDTARCLGYEIGLPLHLRLSRYGIPLSLQIPSIQRVAILHKKQLLAAEERIKNLELENQQLTQQLVTTGVHLAINRQARIQLQEEKKRKVEEEEEDIQEREVEKKRKFEILED